MLNEIFKPFKLGEKFKINHKKLIMDSHKSHSHIILNHFSEDEIFTAERDDSGSLEPRYVYLADSSIIIYKDDVIIVEPQKQLNLFEDLK